MTSLDVDFSRSDYSGPPLTNLAEIIKYVKPTALLGLSTIKVVILANDLALLVNMFIGRLQPRSHRNDGC
jgi:hypothetical protein